MKQKILILMVALVAMVSIHEAKGANVATRENTENTFLPSCLNVKTFTLDNGMTVWINEDHTQPKVYGAVVVKAGAIDCPNTGIAHYFEHIMFKGTDQLGTTDYKAEKPILDSIAVLYDRLGQTTDDAQRMTIQKEINEMSLKGMQYAIPNEFKAITSKMGGINSPKIGATTSNGTFGATTYYDYTYYYNIFSPQYINEWLDLNSHRFIHPVFRMFQSELETVYEEKNMYSDNMIRTTLDNCFFEYMKGTPYAYSIGGSTEHLKNPSLSEMQKFYDKYYVANNMGLILCGDVNADEILSVIQKTFGRIKKGNIPQRPKVTMQEFHGQEGTVKISIPLTIPRRIYKYPQNGTREDLAMSLAISLLNNESGNGLIDSLNNEGKLYLSSADKTIFKYAPTIWIHANNPRGKDSEAEELVMQQIDKLKQGQFSDEALNVIKLEKTNAWKKSLETIEGRSDVLVDAFAMYDLSWQQYQDWQNKIGSITKEEIMDVCKKYFGENNYYRITRENGAYPKDKLSQPGYEPLVSENLDKKSVFAQHLDSLISKVDFTPRLIDFKKDVEKVELSPLTRIYAVKNPLDDIFTLSLKFRKGTEEDSRLEPVIKYVNALGTDKHSKSEYNSALQRIGATLKISTDTYTTTFTITGLDNHFDETVTLLKEMLECPKADREQYEMFLAKQEVSGEHLINNYMDIVQMLLAKKARGNESQYLRRTTYKELKKLSEQELLDIYHDLQHTECDITYSGSLSADQLSSKVENILALNSTQKYTPSFTYEGCAEPVVYFVSIPESRQSIVGIYSLLNQPQDDKGLATLDVWNNYYGGEGTPILSQEIRELRSMAYMVNGGMNRYTQKERYKDPVPYYTVMSTQADKTLDAMAVMDSLWTDMPLRAKNIEVAKCGILFDINNSFPSFREMADKVADEEWNHYTQDANTYKAQNVSSVTPEDVQTLWRNNVKNANRVWYVVGDKKKIDMKALSRFGKVIEVKTKELYKK